VYVLDHSFPKDIFSYEERVLKRPKSSHILSRYAMEYHKQRPFNFNNAADRSVFMAALQPVAQRPLRLAQKAPSHSLLVWPDAFWLHDLVEEDVADVVEALLRDSEIGTVGIPGRKTQPLDHVCGLLSNGGSPCNSHLAMDAYRWSEEAVKRNDVYMTQSSLVFYKVSETSSSAEAGSIMYLPSDCDYSFIYSFESAVELLKRSGYLE
jgi:hypothetical protein